MEITKKIRLTMSQYPNTEGSPCCDSQRRGSLALGPAALHEKRDAV